VLQCVAVCCSVLQCVAVCCSVLQCVDPIRECAVCCSELQSIAVRTWPTASIYGVATISRLLKITGLFCRISSLL